MVVNKCNSLRKIADVILENGYSIKEVLLLEQSHQLFGLIAGKLKNTKYGYPSKVYQAVHHNQNYFVKNFTNNTQPTEKQRFSNDILANALAELQASEKN